MAPRTTRVDPELNGWLDPKRLRRQSRLLYDVMSFIRRYVVLTREQLLAVALWVIHTHCVEAAQQTPYLSITSPERNCGKTRLLEVMELLVHRPWRVITPSEAVAYRYIHQHAPAWLLDEVDTVFNPKLADRYEGLRALLNGGHRRGSTVPRCIGTSKVMDFRVFCPKALAGIGTLPSTVADRAIPIRLVRRTNDETLSRLIFREVGPEATALRDQIAAWAEEHVDALADEHPEMPEDLSDRMQEGCEPLQAIAEALGCGEEARAVFVALLTGDRPDDQESMRVRLLRDIRAVFEKYESNNIHTETLLARLWAMSESPWPSYYGRELGARDLATLLHQFGISSRNVRVSDRVAKGYARRDFAVAWKRYVD